MSIREEFVKLASHMVKGMMTHEQLMNSYLFLGLPGYAHLHEKHYLSETKSYVKLCKYASSHYSMLLQAERVEDPEVIPPSWKDKTRESVTFDIRRQSLEAALLEWINWEESAVEVYSEAFKTLYDAGEIDAAFFVKKFLLDAEEELIFARQELISKRAMDFDIVSIIEEQEKFQNK